MHTACALVLMILPAAAQTPRAEDLVAKHIAARGGAEKIRAISSMRVTRTVGTPFATVRVVMLRQRPSSLRIEQTLQGKPTTARILTPQGAWDETAQGWVARPAAVTAEALEIDGDFDGVLIDSEQKGHRIAYAGVENIGGQPAYHLKVTLKSGAERSVYLDQGTFLERRHTGTITLPNNTKVGVVFDFSDWREVEGVMFPFAIDEDRAAAGQTFAIYVEKIEVNVPVDATAFAPPTAVRK